MQQDSTRTIRRAYKTELDPSPAQRERLLQHAGAVRFLYNLALERCQTEYALAKASGRQSQRPNAMSLNKELTELKRSEECAWLYTVSNKALQNALRQLDTAYTNFFRRLKEGKKGRAAGFPRYKSKKRGIGSFTLNGHIHVFDKAVQLPVIGTVKLKERGYLPKSGVRITSANISERAGRWYVSLQVEEALAPIATEGEVVGIDLGLNHLATLSDGAIIDNPRTLKRHRRRLKTAQRRVSRRKKGSNRRGKAVHTLARQHEKVQRIRQHHLHQHTTAIAKRYGVVVVEDLHVAGMMKNHSLAGALADASLSEFRRQLEYKASWYGCEIVVADRWYPSSKTCSRCGWKKDDLTLKDREFECGQCGLRVDRDLNAALNLRSLVVAGKQPETLNARGGDGRPAQLALAIFDETRTRTQAGHGTA